MFLNAWVAPVLAGYFAVVLGIAVFRSRRMQSMADYMLGNRRLSSFTSAWSARSPSASSGAMLAAPPLVFLDSGMVIHEFLI